MLHNFDYGQQFPSRLPSLFSAVDGSAVVQESPFTKIAKDATSNLPDEYNIV